MGNLKWLGFLTALLLACPKANAQRAEIPAAAKTYPLIELERPQYAACGLRIAWASPLRGKKFEFYDMAIEVYSSKVMLTTVVQAKSFEDDASVKPFVSAPKPPPRVISFGVDALMDPITLKDTEIKDGILTGQVDESHVKHTGEAGGRLMHAMLYGEPTLVFWTAPGAAQKVFRVKTAPLPDDVKNVQSCVQKLH